MQAPSGWAWRSVIQAPHLQTDRDVGASGIGVALLQHYQRTRDRAALTAARRAGDWLLSVAERDSGGLRWPDFVDSRTRRSDSHFTSFDDGTPGIADFLWQLGQATRDARYRRAAVSGMDWIVSQAEPAPGATPGEPSVRWRYYDDADDYRTGMGEGSAGIINSLVTFAARTGDERYLHTAIAGAVHLEHRMTPDGAMPEHAGRSGTNTGFLSGAAGDAYMFLALYRHTSDRRWLTDATRLLDWVHRHRRRDGSWPIEPGPVDTDAHAATGMEEGAAGIGWVELQAWRVTGDRSHLARARQAADWLYRVGMRRNGGIAWPEYIGSDIVHTSLNNGAAGIGWFFLDMDKASPSLRYRAAARGAIRWIESVSRSDGRGGRLVPANRTAGRPRLVGEPSWHWGGAGVAAFLDRAAGGVADTPGMPPALPTG
ncbi:MAG: hypothetical protein JWM90_1510 [Thermoleophilia bacterium]|nr:hypothetical protein [Thermoleophilia bacterium]